MTNQMKTKTGILLLLLLTFAFSSCLFIGPSLKGNGKVVEQPRKTDKFHGVKVTSGMNVQLVQGTENKVVVVADENLLKAIETEVNDGILEVKATANIRRAESKKVVVTVTRINEIRATAGSNLFTENQLESDRLLVRGTAGSTLNISFSAERAEIQASSGANLTLSGEAANVTLKASSGANLNAETLLSRSCETKVSSGANIWISVADALTAEASSGGNIFYYGTPASVNTSSSSGGNIIRK